MAQVRMTDLVEWSLMEEHSGPGVRSPGTAPKKEGIFVFVFPKLSKSYPPEKHMYTHVHKGV